MNRKPTHTPADPWEWFSGTIYHLTKSAVIKIWNISERTVERWSADRTTTESVTRNPLVMLGDTLEKLMEKGKAEFARSAVDFLAKIVGCHLVFVEAIPDKENLSDELLDDLPAISAFHTSMINKEPLAIVRENYRKAKQELDEDYQLYVEENKRA
jgi:hypothetical protein